MGEPDLVRDFDGSIRGLKTSSRIVSKLMEFSGVGHKVADCIALFSCDCFDLVPVDTHVWQLAKEHYGIRAKKLNNTVYAEVQEAFEGVFGARAGWAHSVLFASELP